MLSRCRESTACVLRPTCFRFARQDSRPAAPAMRHYVARPARPAVDVARQTRPRRLSPAQASPIQARPLLLKAPSKWRMPRHLPVPSPIAPPWSCRRPAASGPSARSSPARARSPRPARHGVRRLGRRRCTLPRCFGMGELAEFRLDSRRTWRILNLTKARRRRGLAPAGGKTSRLPGEVGRARGRSSLFVSCGRRAVQPRGPGRRAAG